MYTSNSVLHSRFGFSKLGISLTVCIYEFCLVLWINSEHFPVNVVHSSIFVTETQVLSLEASWCQQWTLEFLQIQVISWPAEVRFSMNNLHRWVR
jgi:hypothetical protein